MIVDIGEDKIKDFKLQLMERSYFFIRKLYKNLLFSFITMLINYINSKNKLKTISD